MADMFKFELRSAGEFFDASFDGQHPAVKTLVGDRQVQGQARRIQLVHETYPKGRAAVKVHDMTAEIITTIGEVY